MGTRQALFQDPNKALEASFEIARRQNRGGQPSRRQQVLAGGDPVYAHRGLGGAGHSSIMPMGAFSELVRDYDGRPWRIHSSSDERELELYDYKEFINPLDRFYLETRDPTAKFATTTMTRDVWAEPPRIQRGVENREQFRRFFLDLYKKRFFQQAWAAHKMARRDGGAFIFIQATGDPSTPLEKGDRFAGFDTIPIFSVPDRFIETTKRSNDPLIQRHGIQRLIVQDSLREDDPTKLDFMEIHGSRLAPVKEDPEGDAPISNPVLNTIHDDLWNWRDVGVSARDGVMQGNPVAVDVKTEEEYSIQRVPEDKHGTDEDPYQVVIEEMEDWQQGYIDSFAPIEGIELKRLGASEVDIPTESVDTYVGRIASALDVTRAKVMATAESGGGQMGNVDQDEYGRAVQALQTSQAFPVLEQMIAVGKRIGLIKRRPELHPGDIEWGDPLFYNARQRAFLAKSHAQAASIIDEQGVRKVPAETGRLLPKDPNRDPAPTSDTGDDRGGDGQGSNNNQGGKNASAPTRRKRRQEIREVIEEMKMEGELDG